MKRRREADSSTLLPARSTSRTTFDVLGMVPLHFSCVRLLQGFLEPVVRGGGVVSVRNTGHSIPKEQLGSCLGQLTNFICSFLGVRLILCLL